MGEVGKGEACVGSGQGCLSASDTGATILTLWF